MWRCVHHLDDQVGTVSSVHFALTGRQLYVCQAILAVPELGSNQLLKKWMLRPSSNRNVAAISERDHPQSIFETLLCGDVTRHNRDRANIEFRRI